MGTDAEQGTAEASVDSFRCDGVAESGRVCARVLVGMEGRDADLTSWCAKRNENDGARGCRSIAALSAVKRTVHAATDHPHSVSFMGNTGSRCGCAIEGTYLQARSRRSWFARFSDGANSVADDQYPSSCKRRASVISGARYSHASG